MLHHPCCTIPREFCYGTMNVNKKLGKLIDAAQPEPPTTEKFINALRKTTQEEDKEACDAAIFPCNAEVALLGGETKGTLKARNGGVKAVLEFEGICRKKGPVFWS